MKTIQLTDKNNIEELRVALPIANSVKSGLKDSNDYFERGFLNDVNSAKYKGSYIVTPPTINSPINDYGLLDVVTASGYIIQRLYALNSNKIYIRRSVDGGNKFNEWVIMNE